MRQGLHQLHIAEPSSFLVWLAGILALKRLASGHRASRRNRRRAE